MQGIPEAAELAPPVARPPTLFPAGAPGTAPAVPAQGAVPAGGPNAAPLDLFPQVRQYYMVIDLNVIFLFYGDTDTFTHMATYNFEVFCFCRVYPLWVAVVQELWTF